MITDRKLTGFIGSSVESHDVARAIQSELYHHAESAIWSQGIFAPSQGTLVTLIDDFNKRDFAVFVLSPDDLVRLRNEDHLEARDNVVLELGISVGILGLGRTFWVIPDMPKDPKKPTFHLPTDLLGLTALTYSTEHFKKEMQPALGHACTNIINQMNKIGLRGKYSFTDMNNGTIDEANDIDHIILIRQYLKSKTSYNTREIQFDCVVSDERMQAPPGTSSRLFDSAVQGLGFGYRIAARGNRLIVLVRPDTI